LQAGRVEILFAGYRLANGYNRNYREKDAIEWNLFCRQTPQGGSVR
jgi:hypothetical protein